MMMMKDDISSFIIIMMSNLLFTIVTIRIPKQGSAKADAQPLLLPLSSCKVKCVLHPPHHFGKDMEQLKILFLGVKFGVKDFTFYTFVVIFVVAVPQQNKTTILMKHDCCVHLPIIRIKSYLLLQLPRAELFSTIKW